MGVKSLWNLLTPVGRPIMLEAVEGKIMAIDSSIWIYQFQATMRDKEGRALVNAHVLGFLRRISKLLFYGIKPVFVFDGGAPALKRGTITERKKKKSGAAASHAKVAERLLSAQLRREALNHAQGYRSEKNTKGKGKVPEGSVVLDESTVYLEDVDPSAPKTLSKCPERSKAAGQSPPSAKKKSRFHDHDPYKLPEVDLEEKIARATRSAAPDPRLATEDELQAFIEDMRPEDFDVTSPAFRELPTEIQYEIIGDLRLKSRQTSYQRLQTMLQNAPTPLDFSKQQIVNLKQRNALTQQLLTTTDSIGKAHISIPVRIASERNKEYVLVKNEGESGGWILGVRDEGTRAKPIEIDQHDEKTSGSDSDAGMEEVGISISAQPDPDLRRYQRETALSAVAKRYTSKNLTPLRRAAKPSTTNPMPLFDLSDEDPFPASVNDASDEDEGLAFAIQDSLDMVSRTPVTKSPHMPSTPSSLTIHPPLTNTTSLKSSTPGSRAINKAGFTYSSRLETALSIANAGPSRHMADGHTTLVSTSPIFRLREPIMIEENGVQQETSDIRPLQTRSSETSPFRSPSGGTAVLGDADIGSEDDMEEVTLFQSVATPPADRLQESGSASPSIVTERQKSNHSNPTDGVEVEFLKRTNPESPTLANREDHTISHQEIIFEDRPINPLRSATSEVIDTIQRPVSPELELVPEPEPMPEPEMDSWDAAQEMDPPAEENEFARFVSQVKGRDLDDVRQEIDEEIRTLNQQKKTAMRDSEDITQQMVSQIMTMLRLFGIPYITAPMEAEAQCATLVSLGLVEGIITDDSDVFLFGGQRVYKNMFNQSKTVECFLLSDLSRELGLDRDTLIRLAYLLGSDYVAGLPGIGPVVAMELLKEFPGDDGLHKFKDWWTKVQSGKDRQEDNQSQFRKQFKRKFKELYLPQEWPDPAVRDAYYYPTVDESDEPFKWGLPDLDALRIFLGEELGWSQAKVDDLLLPIIQRMNRRFQAAALTKQGNLNSFLQVNAADGSHAPRRHQAYASKRLQKVVADFRKKRGRNGSLTPAPDDFEEPRKRGRESGESDPEYTAPPKPKAKRVKSKAAGSKGSRRGGKTRTTSSSNMSNAEET